MTWLWFYWTRRVRIELNLKVNSNVNDARHVYPTELKKKDSYISLQRNNNSETKSCWLFLRKRMWEPFHLAPPSKQPVGCQNWHVQLNSNYCSRQIISVIMYLLKFSMKLFPLLNQFVYIVPWDKRVIVWTNCNKQSKRRQ